jgi:hypothetical protein
MGGSIKQHENSGLDNEIQFTTEFSVISLIYSPTFRNYQGIIRENSFKNKFLSDLCLAVPLKPIFTGLEPCILRH